MQARIQSSLEAFSLFLVFSVQTKLKNISTLKYAFLNIQIGLFILSFFFCRLNCLYQVEVFEAIQHILTSQAGWKIPNRVHVLNTVIEFNRKQE